MIPRSHPLASVREAYNAVFVESRGRRPADVLRPRCRRRADGERRAGRPRHGRAQPPRRRRGVPVSRRTPTARSLPMGETRTRYHVAIDVDDRAGVLAAVAQRLRRPRRVDPDRAPGGSRRRRAARRRLPRRHRRRARATVDAAAQHGHRPRGHLGDARRGRRRVSGGMPARHPPVARRDRGVPRPARPIPDETPGGHARARAARRWSHSEWLSGLTGGEVLAQGRGRQPDRLVQGPRHDGRDLACAEHQGAQAVVCASTGNTSASMAAYAAQGRAQAARAGPRGQDRRRQDGPGGRARRPGDHGRAATSTTACGSPASSREDYPVALVNSVNPVRLQGQKTAAFEIVDFLGDAPDFHLLPVGNAGNISAYWMGYQQYADLGRRHASARGCAASRPRARRRW